MHACFKGNYQTHENREIRLFFSCPLVSFVVSLAQSGPGAAQTDLPILPLKLEGTEYGHPCPYQPTPERVDPESRAGSPRSVGGERMDYSLIGMSVSTCEAGRVRVAVKCVGGLAVNIRG